jgi:hypothetical protein
MALILRSQTSVSALLERAGQKFQFQHGWNMYGSKTPISAWLESVVVKIVSFSMAAMCIVQKRELDHCWSVFWSKSSLSAC